MSCVSLSLTFCPKQIVNSVKSQGQGQRLPNASKFAKERVKEMVGKQAALFMERRRDLDAATKRQPAKTVDMIGGYRLDMAYDHCGDILCLAHGQFTSLATHLLRPDKRRALWALYAWCRRCDELVDGPHESIVKSKSLDIWERRLTEIFEGQPSDMYDAALCDSLSRCPLDIQLFRDMLEGMRVDLEKFRYQNFDELYLYCYYVSGTVILMIIFVLDIAPESERLLESVFDVGILLGLAWQLTEVLSDIGEDAQMGRIYIPQDELALVGLSDDDILRGVNTDRWREFMKLQISRVRMLNAEVEKMLDCFSFKYKWALIVFVVLIQQRLDAIEANDYNTFQKNVEITNEMVLLSGPQLLGNSLMTTVPGWINFPPHFEV